MITRHFHTHGTFCIDSQYPTCYNRSAEQKLQLNNPLCFVHSSTAGHAACWQYSKPDKNLVKRIRPIELGHDKQQLRAVDVMSFFVFSVPVMHQNMFSLPTY